MRSEVTTLPVADVDHAKALYEGLVWRRDIDVRLDEHSFGAVHPIRPAHVDPARGGQDDEDTRFPARACY
jgi:hypothetical protein